MTTKVVVLGAGPAGIMAAFSCKLNNPSYDVVLVDKEDELGSRIKVSGNGKCNFLNRNLSPNKYNNEAFVKTALDIYNQDLPKIMNSLGFEYYFDEEGRGYPITNSSKTVIKACYRLLKNAKVKLKLGVNIISIEELQSGFKLKGEHETILADYLILAIGGVALNNSKDNYIKKVKSLHFTFSPLTPSLCPIKVEPMPTKLDGVRTSAKVILLDKNKKEVFSESGEVLFKKDALSGIVIFNCSCYLSRKHEKDLSNYVIELDLLNRHQYEEKELVYLLQKHAKSNKNERLSDILNDFFVEQISEEICNRYGANSFLKNKIDYKKLAHIIKHFSFSVKELYSFKSAQVMSGGISLNEINPKTLRSKQNPSILVCGEELDIDGVCGGYNISWAMASGYLAGKLL